MVLPVPGRVGFRSGGGRHGFGFVFRQRFGRTRRDDGYYCEFLTIILTVQSIRNTDKSIRYWWVVMLVAYHAGGSLTSKSFCKIQLSFTQIPRNCNVYLLLSILLSSADCFVDIKQLFEIEKNTSLKFFQVACKSNVVPRSSSRLF